MSKIPLNELITLQRGYDLPKDKRKNGNIPVVASTGIVGYHNEHKAKANGVVIGRSGSIGGGQYITTDFFPLNTTLYVKDFKGHNPRFIYYLLKSIDFSTFNVGSGVPTLNRNHLSSLLIDVLDIKAEEKIAKILGAFDDKINLNHQINHTLEQIAGAIFKSWFVDFDPVRAKADILANGGSETDAILSAMSIISGKSADELAIMQQNDKHRYDELWQLAESFPSGFDGDVPSGWGMKKVGDIAKFVKGKKPNQVSNTQEYGMLPHILVASLTGKYSEFAPIERAVICQNQETLVLMDGSGSGKIAIGHNGIVGSTLAKINLSDKKYWAIIYLFLKNKEPDIQQHTTGTSIPHTDKTKVLNYDLIIPCNFTLNWFNVYFENTLNSILNHRNESLSLEKTRDELLPKLLSGEIEL